MTRATIQQKQQHNDKLKENMFFLFAIRLIKKLTPDLRSKQKEHFIEKLNVTEKKIESYILDTINIPSTKDKMT